MGIGPSAASVVVAAGGGGSTSGGGNSASGGGSSMSQSVLKDGVGALGGSSFSVVPAAALYGCMIGGSRSVVITVVAASIFPVGLLPLPKTRSPFYRCFRTTLLTRETVGSWQCRFDRGIGRNRFALTMG